MFKFLLIFGVVSYILYKIGSFFFRAGAAAQQLRNMQNQQQQQQRFQSEQSRKKSRKGKSGEYVDFEEVK